MGAFSWLSIFLLTYNLCCDIFITRSMKPAYKPIRKTFVIDQQLLDFLTRRANAHKTSLSYELRQMFDEYITWVSNNAQV